MKKIEAFKRVVWDYYQENKRDLPWRNTTNPYHIFISEVMLQQTQVSRIIPKYFSFIEKFLDFHSLATASISDVLKEWKGIGYNRRALYLKNAAQIIDEKYSGVIPDDPAILTTLPGIGSATASSIIVYSYNKPVPFIETNVRRIFIHHFFADKENIHDREIEPLVIETIDHKNPREWYWALMDYGTMLAKTVPNPNRKSKHYVKQSKFEGSTRQLRSRILHYIVERASVTYDELQRLLDDERVTDILRELVKEGFVKKGGEKYTIA